MDPLVDGATFMGVQWQGAAMFQVVPDSPEIELPLLISLEQLAYAAARTVVVVVM